MERGKKENKGSVGVFLLLKVFTLCPSQVEGIIIASEIYKNVPGIDKISKRYFS